MVKLAFSGKIVERVGDGCKTIQLRDGSSVNVALFAVKNGDETYLVKAWGDRRIEFFDKCVGKDADLLCALVPNNFVNQAERKVCPNNELKLIAVHPVDNPFGKRREETTTTIKGDRVKAWPSRSEEDVQWLY